MTNVEGFLTALAWVFGVLSVLMFVLRVIGGVWYAHDKMAQIRDKLCGVERTYPVFWPVIVMIICWVWILTR